MPEDEGTPGKKRGKGKQGRSWNKEDDKKLERLLKNGDIDIRENLGVTNTGLIFTRKVWSTFPKSHDDGLHTTPILHGIVPSVSTI